MQPNLDPQHAAQLLVAAQSCWQREWTVAVELVSSLKLQERSVALFLQMSLTHYASDPLFTTPAVQCVHVQARAFGFQVVNASQEANQKVTFCVRGRWALC